MPTISFVLFDLDDVLGAYDRPAHIAQIAGLAGKQPDEVAAAIWGSGFDAEADAGRFDADAYLRGFDQRIGYPLTRKEWVVGRKAFTEPMADVIDLARAVGRNVPIAVLTNNTTLVTDHIDELLPTLRPLFGEAFYASAALGRAKPDPEAFHRCLARCGARPEQTLFIDDLEENAAGARRAGLTAHRHTSAEALADVLRRYRLL